jgi:hypothetical protein
MDGLIEIPLKPVEDTVLFSEWLLIIVSDFFLASEKEKYNREYKIIQYRFGLNGQSTLTLEETGIIFDVSRERIRQIEREALRHLAMLVNKGVNERRSISLNRYFFERIRRYKESLCKFGDIVNEFAVADHTIEYFSEANIDLPLLRLLLTLFGFKSISLETEVPERRVAWVLQDIDANRIEKAMHAVYEFLQDVAIAKPYEEVKLSINRKRSSRSRFSDQELNQAIDLSYDIERLDEGTIQLRYERLRTLPNKVYRILHNAGEPIHIRQLAIILNKEAFKYDERSRITPHNVGVRLSGDSRFKSIGRSGEWILSEWQEYSTESILDLMEDSLHAAGEPLSLEVIFDYVSARRPVEEKAIASYLSQEQRFVRVGVNSFALSDWGMSSVATTRTRPVNRVLSKAKLCEYIELTFHSKNVGEMFVADLAREVSKLEPGVSTQSIYNAILKSPAVKTVNRKIGKRTRKVALFVTDYRKSLTKLDILSKDIPVGELIQNTVREMLENSSGHCLELSTIRDSVSQELHCPPSSVYHAVSNMEDVRKVKNDSDQVVCVLEETTEEYFDDISDAIEDKLLLSQIKRSLSLVNIDSIDLALFQLGKVFEYTLKRYMQEVKKQSLIPVTKHDLSKLFNMVQWTKKHQIIVDETALQYLRIERNDRAHGVPPDKDEREALLKNASTLIQFYLDYILLIEKRREKLIAK